MTFVYQTIIGASTDIVLDALLNPSKTEQYYYGFTISGDWKVGGKYQYTQNDQVSLEGKVTELIPGKKIAMTFNGKWMPEVAAHAETLVEYEIFAEGANTYLKLTHSGLEENSYAAAALPKGWVNIISGMKTLIETGKPLDIDMAATMQNH